MTTDTETPLEIRHAFALDGALHAVTTDGRLWRRSYTADGGWRWYEVDPPMVPKPAWLREAEEWADRDFNVRR